MDNFVIENYSQKHSYHIDMAMQEESGPNLASLLKAKYPAQALVYKPFLIFQ
jgi:hypothetical protein